MKNKKNKVGAPSKPVNWPKTPFTVKELATLNKSGDSKQCALSLRQKVAKLLNSRKLVKLEPVRQPGESVGRPNFAYVLRENFNPEKHIKAGKAKSKKSVKVSKQTVSVMEVAPTAPIAEPAVSPVVTSPAVSTPATVTSVVESAPMVAQESPAPMAEAVPTSVEVSAPISGVTMGAM